jgi:hypothetical protein
MEIWVGVSEKLKHIEVGRRAVAIEVVFEPCEGFIKGDDGLWLGQHESSGLTHGGGDQLASDWSLRSGS